MPFIIRDCHRCGTAKVQMKQEGIGHYDSLNSEVFVVCNSCGHGSLYQGQVQRSYEEQSNLDQCGPFDNEPIQVHPTTPILSSDIPERTRDLFNQAAQCRRYGLYEPAGAMFRKTIDVGSKQFYQIDSRLVDKEPAKALRSRLDALGKMQILGEDIVELADIAALDGNDATHDEDPYTAAEAEALEELTIDLLDRMFVRPANIQRVKAKQIASGLRKPES